MRAPAPAKLAQLGGRLFQGRHRRRGPGREVLPHRRLRQPGNLG